MASFFVILDLGPAFLRFRVASLKTFKELIQVIRIVSSLFVQYISNIRDPKRVANTVAPKRAIVRAMTISIIYDMHNCNKYTQYVL